MNQDSNDNLQEWEAQLAEYTLGTMEPGAAAEFERQLIECRTHVVLSYQYAQMVGLLGSAAPTAEPPVGHKDRFLSRLAATPRGSAASIPETPAVTAVPPVAPTPSAAPQPAGRVTDIGEYRERRRARPSWPIVAAIAAALVVLIGGTAWLTSALIQPATPQVVAFPIQGTPSQPGASAQGFVDTKTNQAYIVTNRLQPNAPNQVYELWWLPASGNPVAAGTFTVDVSGKGGHTAPAPGSVASYTGLAVSLEQAPGVTDAPHGPVVLEGNYSVHQ